MKNYLMLVLVTTLTTGAAIADTSSAKKSVQPDDKATQKTTDKVAEKNSTIIDEAVSAMKDTQKALTSLSNNNKKEAQDALRSATGKLEMVVARKPQMGLAPFQLNVTTHALLNDAQSVENLKTEAINALKDNRVQEARQIVSQLRSDTVISVASIPVATYPAALKDAARLIDQNKLDEAKAAITSALGTVVMTETIIPLPLARADFFIDDASKLSAKKNRTQEEKQQLTQDIKNGKESLQMAEALGYTPKDAFKDSIAKLDEASKNAEAGKSGDNWFQDVKAKISSFFGMNDHGQKQAQEE
jgi:hypothetical protein